MLKKLTIAAFIFTLALAGEASAIVKSIPPRSAAQTECMEQNPNDHQAYLACIEGKKAERRNNREEQRQQDERFRDTGKNR